MTQENKEESPFLNDPIEATITGLAEKRNLLLAVEVTDREQAEEIIKWMYAKEKPMKAILREVSWDKIAVPKQIADAIDLIRAQ